MSSSRRSSTVLSLKVSFENSCKAFEQYTSRVMLGFLHEQARVEKKESERKRQGEAGH